MIPSSDHDGTDGAIRPETTSTQGSYRPLLSNVQRLLHAPPFLRRHILQAMPLYWRLRTTVRRTQFYANRSLWNVFRASRSVRERGVLGAAIAKLVLLPVGLAIALVACLRIWDERMPVWPGFIFLEEPSAEAFVTLATALAGVGAAFLGLYFTAVSVVASTSYRDVPDDVRGAALGEKVGSFYLTVLAILTAVSVLLSALLVAGLNPGRLNLLLLSGLGVASIFSFVPLGRRAFSFLDPVQLGDSLGREILEAATLAGAKRHYRESPSFQAAYQRNAERAISTLENVVLVCLREAHQDPVALRRTAKHLLALVSAYIPKKRSIPSESLWFPRRPEFRSWLASDGSHLEMALQTATQLQPKPVANAYWVEERLFTALGRIISVLFEGRHYDAANDVLATALRVIESLTYEHRFREAHLLSRTLAKLDLAVSAEQPAPAQLARRLALDMTHRGAICMTIGLGRLAEDSTTDMIREWVESTLPKRGDKRSADAPTPPDAVGEKLDFLRQSAAFELSTEGTIITPPWFGHHFVAGAYLEYLFSSVRALLADLRLDYIDEANRLASTRPMDAVQLVQTGLEACHKLGHHAAVVSHMADSLRALERPIAEHDWPPGSMEATATAIRDLSDQLVEVLVALAPALPQSFEPQAAPDDFGYVYVTLAEEMLRKMLRGDQGVVTMFPAYFMSALSAHDRLREELSALPNQTKMAFSSDILADLCDISGYAYVLHDLGKPLAWQVVAATWDSYLKQYPQTADLLKLIAASLTFLDNLFAVTPRSVIRTGWRRIFAERLVEQGLATREDHWRDELEPTAGGPTARAFLQGTLSAAHDVFMACYLSKQQAFGGTEIPRAAQGFVRDLTQLVRRESEERGESEDEGHDDGA